MGSSDYLLLSEPELERLRLQARMWQPAAEQMLDCIGIQKGWRCVDLGCGALGILEPLSKRCGQSGTVVGVDKDGLQLAAARSWIREKQLVNTDVLEADIYDTGLPQASFDFVHVRFVFAPCGRVDELLNEMIRLARRGGIISIQEPDAASWNCYPPNRAWTVLQEAILKAFDAGGGDFNIGRRLYPMLLKKQLKDVQLRSAVLSLPGSHPYASLPIQFAASLRSRILSENILTESQLDEAIAELKTVLQQPASFVTTFLVNQVWAML